MKPAATASPNFAFLGSFIILSIVVLSFTFADRTNFPRAAWSFLLNDREPLVWRAKSHLIP